MKHIRTPHRAAALGICALAATVLACSTNRQPVADVAATAPVAEPIAVDGAVYDFAATVPLTPSEPEEHGSLHNVFRLSENIVSGSEPHDADALRQLKEWGIRTIISVDGSEPMAEEAAALGMRYVHVPIQYKGITSDEKMRIAKTFRELEGPFYVHCFHGKHRGPAAAAVGRVVLDGIGRDRAVAEMRQYCGTAKSYEGLYQAIALQDLPDSAASAAYEFGFDPVSRPKGIVGTMVHISRAHDHLVDLAARDFAADPLHPDVDALNEAKKLLTNFRSSMMLEDIKTGPSDQVEWFHSSISDSERLVAALEKFRAGNQAAKDEAKAAFASVKKTCATCHDSYRN
ncbi:MAG: hypothetical protein GC161_13010 [Planctomycetaceae bacterium]|nr:hypothetical protein [Planctomycetaceae bacterium]